MQMLFIMKMIMIVLKMEKMMLKNLVVMRIMVAVRSENKCMNE